MKTQANWPKGVLAMLLALLSGLWAVSCGGGGGGADLGSNPGSGIHAGSAPERGTGQLVLIHEEDIASLPDWQQRLLADPGWNQPYITPRGETPMPAPSHELLLAETQKALAGQAAFSPRLGGEAAAGKGTSWIDQSPYVPPTVVDPGEYDTLYGGAVPYGCKDANTANGHSRDRNIAAYSVPLESPSAISYCKQGLTSVNHFNTTGGAGSDALSCVYQIFASDREADPTRPLDDYGEGETVPVFAEVSYRADGGPGAGGPCGGSVEAYSVRGFFWWKYNSDFGALPGGNSTALYNILVGPASDRSGSETNGNNTEGMTQDFYFGNVSGCYGGAMMVGLLSADSACEDFNTFVNNPDNQLFFTNPIYGVLLKRWQDSVLASMPGGTDPWDADFGFPVNGPITYNNGSAVLTGQGAYYAWGMYFERGFVWWIDYQNNANVPDEAQSYMFSGANVYCGDDETYEKLPTIFYGGSGPLGVSVVVEASLNPDRGPGTPAPGSFYEVGVPNDGLDSVSLDMHAHGYGGTPQAATCAYKHYTWAFRDGSMGLTNNIAYDNSTQYVQHSYGSIARNQLSIYVVRVQVVDSTNAIAYGDSLPIHLGTGGGGGGGEIWLIRNDGGDYNANYDALVADLDALGALYTAVDYSDTVADDFNATGEGKVAIWYRGGPGAAGEPTPYTTNWTTAEIDNYLQIMNDAYGLWLVSQSNGYQYYYRTFGYPNGWSGGYGFAIPNPQDRMPQSETRHPWAAGIAVDDGWGFGGSWGFIPTAPTDFIGSPDGRFGSDSTNAAERNSGAGSSGDTPISFTFGDARQFSGLCFYGPGMQSLGEVGPNGRAGVYVTPQAFGYDLGAISWGNTAAPESNVGFFPSYNHTPGPGKLWITGYGWNETVISASSSGSMTRADLMRNILSWLDSGLTFSSGTAAVTNQGFAEYEGIPEIVSVTPAYWDDADHMYRAGTPTLSYNGPALGAFFPDQNSGDIYRSSDNPAFTNEIISTDPNNNWINGNDVDFQFPFYAYIDDGANNAVESGAGAVAGNNWNNTDDSVSYRGLKLADGNNSWARLPVASFNPTDQNTYPAIMKKQNDQLTNSPMPWVSGFYGGQDSGDETFASYGPDAHAFSGLPGGQEWKNDYPLTVESIAHWSQSLQYFAFPPINNPQPPKLNWAMYPGQNMAIPAGFTGAGSIIGTSTDWDSYRKHFDVDPSFAAPNRTGSTWNRPAFSFTQPTADGRVVEFNYKKVFAWNGDLNRDNAKTNADKFPIRCRLFSNHQAYYTKTTAAGSVWPNQMANPGSPPPAGINLPPTDPNYPSFIEGGCYVVDYGDPVYKVQLADDPAQLDPKDQVQFVGGTGPTYTWNVTLGYLIKFGQTPFTMELDPAYDGVFGPTTISLGVKATGGAKTDVAAITALPGNYTFAIRVTDTAVPPPPGINTATYVWPNPVTLGIPMQMAIMDDPFSQAPSNRDVTKMQADWEALWGAGTTTIITNAQLNAGLASNALNSYKVVAWPVDVVGGTVPYNVSLKYTLGPGNANRTAVLNAHNQAYPNGTSVIMAGAHMLMNSQIANSISPGPICTISPYNHNGSGWSLWWFGSLPGPGATVAHVMRAPANSVPNVVTGMNTAASFEAGFIGWRCPGIFDIQTGSINLKSTNLPVDYPAGNCLWFGTAYFTNYSGCAWAIRQTGYPGGAPDRRARLIGITENYGDIMNNVNGNTRAHMLENMLCAGVATSQFNSPN